MDAMSTQEGHDELHALFVSLDKNGTGTISGKEWGSAVSQNKTSLSKFFGGMTVQELGKTFKRLDTDGSGDLSWDEFVAGVESFDAATRMAQAVASVEGAAELKGLFETIDANSDGTVTADEWGAALSENAELIAKYFGGSGKKGSSKKTLTKAFKRLDTEGKNALSWDDFVAGSQRLVAT
jgi:Ca2+-binding EF-hand superfamily protein